MSSRRSSDRVRRRPSRAAALAEAKKQLDAVLERSGYNRLRREHGGNDYREPFPTLTVEERTAPCSNGLSGSTAVKTQPPGARRFPVGHSHKQGLELITPGSDPQWYGGKKP